MKKIIIIILFILSCSSCKAANRIYYDMYIASIGLEKADDGYNAYFYLPSSVDVGQTDKSSDGKASEVAKVWGETLVDVFSNLDLSTALKMNLEHISSIVLNESMMNNDELLKLIEYVKNSHHLDYNFYLFVTNDKMEDLYSLENPNDESVILSLLCDPIANTKIYSMIEPPHFLNFCRDFYNDKTFGIPLISAEAIWNEKDDSVYSSGACYYNRLLNSYRSYNDLDFRFLKKHEKLDYSDENISVVLKNYNVKLKYDNSVDIRVSSKYEILYSNVSNVEEYLRKLIISALDKLIDKNDEIDFLNLKYNDSLAKPIKININLKEK